MNLKASELLGYTMKELEAMNISDIDTKIEYELWSAHWERLNVNDSEKIEREYRKKDGSVIPVEIYSNFLECRGENYIVAFVQDITERKQKDEIIREKDKLLREIGKLVKVGAWKIDVETMEVRSTEEVAAIYDYDSVEDVTVENGL